MSRKNKDKYNRWRNITIAFRVTEEENALLNRMVKISGLTKQEYLTSNMLKRDIGVSGNPKVYKGGCGHNPGPEYDQLQEELCTQLKRKKKLLSYGLSMTKVYLLSLMN